MYDTMPEEQRAYYMNYGKHFNENDVMYDSAYVFSMVKADFMGSSIEDEKHALLYVKDYIDDPDAADGQVFTRFYASCVNAGIPIDWSEML